MPLINCKVELKIKWTKHCVEATDAVDNTNANPNHFIFTMKDTKYYHVPESTLSVEKNKNLSKPLWQHQIIRMNIKRKNENKDTTNEYRYFLESNFVGVNRLCFGLFKRR